MERFDREPREVDEAPGILQSAWRYKWILVTAALLGALLGYVVEARQPTLYEGVSRLLVSTRGDELAGNAPEFGQEPERFLRNQAEVIRSWPVMELATELSGVGVSPGELSARTTVEVASDSDVITVRVLNATPRGAARLADAVGRAYSRFVAAQSRSTAAEAVNQLEKRERDLNSRLDELAGTVRLAPNDRSLEAEQKVLQQQLEETVRQRVANQGRVQIDPVELRERAATPLHPAQPAPRRAAAAGLLFGLVVSGALAWWLNSRRAEQPGWQAGREPSGQPSAVPGADSEWPVGGPATSRPATLAAGRPVEDEDLNESEHTAPAFIAAWKLPDAPVTDGPDSLIDLFARLDAILRSEDPGRQLQDWSQAMAAGVIMRVHADMVAILRDNGEGWLEVAGDFGLVGDERNLLVDPNHDVLRQTLADGVGIFQDADRLRAAAAAGLPGSRTAEEVVVMVPLVQGHSWVGMLLVGRRSENGHGATAFDDNEVENIILYAVDIAPTVQALSLLYRLDGSLRAFHGSRSEQPEPAPRSRQR
jgi:capsular polysaccharide biosynthesis protein